MRFDYERATPQRIPLHIRALAIAALLLRATRELIILALLLLLLSATGFTPSP